MPASPVVDCSCSDMPEQKRMRDETWAHLLGSVGSADEEARLTPAKGDGDGSKRCRLSSSVTGRAASGVSVTIDGSKPCEAPALAANRLRMSRAIAYGSHPCCRTGWTRTATRFWESGDVRQLDAAACICRRHKCRRFQLLT